MSILFCDLKYKFEIKSHTFNNKCIPQALNSTEWLQFSTN